MAVFTIAILAFADTQCYIFSGQTLGLGEIGSSKQASAGACCDACAALDACISWTFHDTMPAGSSSNCFLKDNVRPEDPPRPVNPHNTTMTGLTSVSQTCDPTSGSICPSGAPCPTNCGAPRCSCHVPESKASPFACLAPHDAYPFCDAALSVEDRVRDLIGRVNASDKPNLLTARGHGSPHKMQAIPALGVPVYYWGTNCLHSMNGGKCVIDSMNRTKCPTNFPSGPSFGATFDRALIQKMANAIGVELRAMFILKLASPSLDCWGPVVNLNRDPRWGRNGEGGTEDGYAMGELAAAWTKGFQAPRPVIGNRTGNSNRELLQGVITLKHMSVNSLENTEPFNRHNFDANRTYGVSPFVLADYYLKPFAAAIGQADARGVMCSYNAVLGKPTCLSPLMRNARKSWGFQGYVTSDSDSVENAFADHHYPANDRGQNATALALTDGQCDIDSGDTYYTNIPLALRNASLNSEFQAADVDRALYNTFKQRFDLGLFDPVDAYDWPTADDVGTDVSQALSLNASREALVLLRNGNPKLTATQPLLPLAKGRKIAVIGPHATAREVMTQPYPFKPYCAPDPTNPHADQLECITSPFAAIQKLNGDPSLTTTAPGCDLFDPSQANFSAALALARAADVVVVGLGIETCGLNARHNVNPARPGRCYQEKSTTGYVFPDQYTELEAHDRTTIALPPVQEAFAAAVLALNKPTLIFFMNAGAVAFDAIDRARRSGNSTDEPLAIVEAFYPGVRGGEALAESIFGETNAWGRLPYTIYPLSFEQDAAMTMHDLRVSPGRTYRYFRDPLYPFGAGLSLTQWSVTSALAPPACSLATTDTKTPCEVTLSVKNTGTRSGDCVLLAYFAKNATDADWYKRRAHPAAASTLPPDVAPADLLSPLRELFDYTRLHDVAPGETRSVTFAVTAKTLALVDESTGDLVAQAGEYAMMFDSGAGFMKDEATEGGMLTLRAKVTGKDVVVTPFPSQKRAD